MRKFIKYIVFIILIAAAVTALNLFFSSRTVETYQKSARTVVAAKAQSRTITQSVTLHGYVESKQMVPVVPFVSGTVEEYMVKTGDSVEKDQVVAVIDKEPYELQYRQAEAAFTAYESSYNRLVRLADSGAATQQDLDTVKSQRDAAEAQLELAALQLSYTQVKTNIAGTVIIADAAVGDIVSTSTPLAVVMDPDNLIVDISVPEKYYQVFKDNMASLQVSIFNETTGASCQAEVESIAPYIDPASKSFKVRLALTDTSAFTAGMYVKAEIGYQTYEDVMTLEDSALKADGSLYYVEDGRARYIAPWDAVHSQGCFIVPEGYEDKLFIVEGQNFILDNEPVTVKER